MQNWTKLKNSFKMGSKIMLRRQKFWPEEPHYLPNKNDMKSLLLLMKKVSLKMESKKLEIN